MNINFVSHLDPFSFNGGGEQYTRKIIEEGMLRGHSIKRIYMRPLRSGIRAYFSRYKDPDLWMLFDIFNCSDEKRHFPRKFINTIIQSGKYVLGQNAYGDICYLNALPCNGEIGDGKRCVEQKEYYYGYRGNSKKSKWKHGYCPIHDNRMLFCNALLNIFLSPLHAQVFHTIYPATAKKTFILRPLVDLDTFYNKYRTRDIKYASYGGSGETKGFYNIRERFPDEEIVFFGSSSRKGGLAAKYRYGKNVGRIPYEQMPDFLNRVQNLIHIPRWPEPHGLIVNQAALCGCNLITNENVGACTHTFDMLDRAAYRTHASLLWDTLEMLSPGI